MTKRSVLLTSATGYIAGIADEYGVPFRIVYGVSNNTRTFWSIANARQVIGYQPEDDSEQRFAEDIARMRGES